MNNVELKDYYGLLRIPPSATISDIHKAYWLQASRCHPDKGGSHEAMVLLVEAWKILSDPNKRSRYDQLLKYRQDGWHSKKFNDDVQNAHKRAQGDSSRSWAEFEAIYQKAFYTFNQDFYGEVLQGKTSGCYSPLMGYNSKELRVEAASKSKPAASTLNTERGTVFVYIMKTLILSVMILAALLLYRHYSGIGRYVPLGQQDASYLLILDTANGSVYSVKKNGDTISAPWQKIVSPFTRDKKWSANR